MRMSAMWSVAVTAGLAAAGGLWGCSEREAPAEPAGPAPEAPSSAAATEEGAAAVRAESVGSIGNLHVAGHFYLAGQPSPEDFELLKERGVRRVINLRTEGEVTAFDEAEVCGGLGLAYHHLPIRGPETLTDEVLDRGRALLAEAGDEPTLIHCGSANRAGAIWLVKRVVDDGLGWEEAVAEARTVGLRTEGFIDRARAYAERQRQGE